MATALDLVNAVMRRLRESEVTTFTAAYSKLILDLLNETMREIEESWDWTYLRSTKSFNTEAGEPSYSVTSIASIHRAKNYDSENRLYNDTDDTFIYLIPQDVIEYRKYIYSTSNAAPRQYRWSSNPNGVGVIIDLYPTPDAVYTIKFPVIDYTADMAATTDTFFGPRMPIILGTWARAIAERGEDQGLRSTDVWLLYQQSLGDHIALDAAKVPDETVWKVK